MPYSLISKPLKLSEAFQDKKKKTKAKKPKVKSYLGTGTIILASVLVCVLILSVLSSAQTTTRDLTDLQKSEITNRISIRMGEGVELASVNAEGQILEAGSTELKADITLVTTPKTTSVCEGTCSTNTELELFDEARVYIQENSSFQINSLDFTNNQAEFTVSGGRVWVRAPRYGQIKLNVDPYTIILEDRAVADLEVLDSQITLNQISRFSSITNTDNQSSLQLTARQTAIAERDVATIVSSISPRIFQDITLDTWDIGRMAEERAWLKSQQGKYAETSFTNSEVNGFLKNWFAFMIVSDEERASAKFGNLDTLITEALETPDKLNILMREFNKEALAASASSKETVQSYLLGRWEKLRYEAPYTLASEKIQEPEYQIKSQIEETYTEITGSADFFQWERVYFFEDLLSELNTTSALAVLEQYYKNLDKNITKYSAADLNAQLLYLENLFSANTVYIYEDFWDTLFEIEYTVLNQLDTDEADAFGSELIIEKIKQVGYLWLGTDKYDASLVAKTIMGEFSFLDSGKQIKYSFFRDNYDKLVALNSFVAVIFEENSAIIEKSMNYQSGKNEEYTLTNDDIFAMEFYQEYISYLENKPVSYQRPPTLQDVLNRFTELGLSVQTTQVSALPGWIELANHSYDRFDLTGWFLTKDRLENNPKRYAVPAQTINPGQYITLDFDAKTLELSPSGQLLYLYDADENLRTSVNYPSIPKGLTYSLQTEGYYGWTQATKGLANDRLILPKGAKVEAQNSIVISEISPLDQYRFKISGIKLQQYNFDVVYDYALNVFSEVGSDAKTLVLIGELGALDEEFNTTKTPVYYNEAVAKAYFLPVDLVNLVRGLKLYPENEFVDIALAQVLATGPRSLYNLIAQSRPSEISALVDTIVAQSEQTQLAEIFIVHNFTFKNFLALPTRLDDLAFQKETYHAAAPADSEQTSLTTATSLQILQTLIRDQLLTHEIYINVASLTDCDTETYKSCFVQDAWIMNPEKNGEKIYFSFDYNIETKQISQAVMQRQNYVIADVSLAVALRQAVISANQFLNNVEEVSTLVQKELSGWTIRLDTTQISHTDETLQEFSIKNVYISRSGKDIYFSAIYNAVNKTLRQIKFDDGKVFNRPLAKDEFKKLTETLYSGATTAE